MQLPFLLISICGWAMVIGFPLYGSRRGSSHIVCTGVVLAVSTVVIAMLAPWLADMIPIGQAEGQAGQGIWSLILFFVFLIGSFPLGAFLTRFLQWSFDPFDRIVGFLLGCVVVFVAERMFFSSLMMMYVGLPSYDILNNHFIVRQIVYLDGWHSFVHWITNIGRPEIEVPND